jgi:hypothetical protein
MIATEPHAELGRMFDGAVGSGKPRIGQIVLSYDPDRQIAVKRAMDQSRWFTGGWRVNAELPALRRRIAGHRATAVWAGATVSLPATERGPR